jgi:hypothetical protein
MLRGEIAQQQSHQYIAQIVCIDSSSILQAGFDGTGV